MDIKAILKSHGIEEEVASTIAEKLNAEIPKEFVSKKQYQKKVSAIDELNETIADLEAKATSNGAQEELDKLKQEFETYKNNIETEKTNATKSSTLREQLKAEGFNEKMIKLLEKNFDLETIEIEEDKIKGWEDMIKPIREEYADFIPKETQTGNPPATPPTNVSGKTYTTEMLKSMSAQEIAQNYDAIRQNLN
nr:MAG TPA: minor structural protein [Caudoviricetes sp.]